MKLLFDQNLSRKLVVDFVNNYPGSRHVAGLGLSLSTDREIWEFARKNDFCIISKDADFHQLSFLFGAPPKTIWLRVANCSTNDLVALIAENEQKIGSFLLDAESALLVLEIKIP